MSVIPLGPHQNILTDTRCVTDTPEGSEQFLAPGLNILCVAASCTRQFPVLSDVLVGLGNGVQVVLPTAQQLSPFFWSCSYPGFS